MIFFTNPKGVVSRKRRGTVVRRKARSRSSGGTMARRRSRKGGRRRASVRHRRRAVVRRRRRRSGTAAVALRRRGVTVYRSNPPRRRRRSYRRNPFGSAGGLVTTIKNGVKDGAVILASQIATRKALNLAQGVIPIKGIPGVAIAGLGVPVIITLVARKVAPNFARLASAAAFAEGLRDILSATPVGPFLADVIDADNMSNDMSAYPAPQVPPNMGAYPGGGLADADEYAA